MSAARYKLYNNLRRQLKQDPRSNGTPKERKLNAVTTFKDTQQAGSTPQKQRRLGHEQRDQAFAADKENLSPSADRSFVGPTPQKDGRVLGLFDLLSPPGRTPSKAHGPASRRALESSDANTIPATPSKSGDAQLQVVTNAALVEATPVTAHKHSRTPQSLGKRFLLDSFLTPSKRRRLDTESTPSSNRKAVESSTPAFLNRTRSGLATVVQNGEADEVNGQRIGRRPLPRSRVDGRRRGLTRSLSSMIADLRKAEDDRLDDEIDMLREMHEPIEAPTRKPSAKRKAEDVLVEDGQVLGPDGTADASEAEEEVELGRDGKPLRVWKKKGLKRQTRKVHMKPRARRRSPERQEQVEEESDAEKENVKQGRVNNVAETQAREPVQVVSKEDAADDSDFSEGASDVEDDRPEASPAKRRKTVKTTQVPPLVEATRAAGNDGFVQKTMKTISASAHANFRKLKIKSSKGAKAAQRGKFGRGRR